MQGGGPGVEPLSIRLLGSPEVSFGGQGLRFGRKKALALLSYLAAEGGTRPRRELAELLWPTSEERRARTDLRSILTNIRKALEGGGHGHGERIRFLAIDGDLLGIEPRRIELDLRILEAALSLARSETSETSPRGRTSQEAIGRRDVIVQLEEALEGYRGDFMEGFSLGDTPEFELWLESERVRWRGVFGELCERLSRLQVEAGRLEEAIGTARLWARHAPLEEAAHLRLVELLSAAGSGEGALLSYQYFRNTLRRELNIEPSLRMRELAGRLREEAEERGSLGASLARWEATASPLSALDVPFVGRQEEFGVLVSEYHACLSSKKPCVVALMGEAGIGKTRLAKEFLGWARARGADVLEGAASEGAGLPYGPLVEAMRSRIERERAPDDLLEDSWLAELSRLLPELKERYPDLPPAASGEGGTAKGTLFEAIARAVGALASRAPVVLFLDDLQWADATTLEVLDYAGRRWAEQGAPVLLVIAARPEEPISAFSLEGRLSSLGRGLPVRGLGVGPLGSEDVEKMLRRLAKGGSEPGGVPEGSGKEPNCSDQARSELERLGEWLAAESDGQPFYLVETLKSLLEEEKLVVRARPDGGGVLEVGPALEEGSALRALLPHSVREVIGSRLSRLSGAASELLAAGAVLGRRFGFESLLGVVGVMEEEGLRGLEELIGRRLLLEDGGGQEGGTSLYLGATYSFSHEKIRQVTYTNSGQARRRLLHRRAFEVLEGGGAPPSELARHALAGGLAEPSFAYSLAAGDAAAEVFAVRDAIVHYERVRDVLAAEEQRSGGIEPSPQDLEHFYTQLGRAYEMADEHDKARAAYETMLAFARRAGEARLEVAALNHLAVFLFHHKTDPEVVRMLLERAREVAEEAHLKEALAETECNLADILVFRTGEFARSRLLAEKALTSARDLGRPGLVARTLTALARHEVHAGRLEEAADHAEEGAALSRELAARPATVGTGLPSILTTVTGLSASWRAGNKAMEIQCLIYLAYTRIYQGRPREGVAVAREARAISGDLPERMETRSLLALGAGLQEAGEYEEALALARRGAQRAREVRDAFLLGANLGRLGDACIPLLNLEEARAAYEEAVERGHYGALSPARLSAVAALSGNWEDALVHARRAHEYDTFLNPLLSVYLHHGAEALLRGGDEDIARVEVHRLAERARTNQRDLMSYLRSLAVMSEWEDDMEQAVNHLRKAEAIAEDIAPPGELWQIQNRIGELYERRGEAGEAREAFSRAAQTVRDLAERIKNKQLRENFLSAPQVHRVLARL